MPRSNCDIVYGVILYAKAKSEKGVSMKRRDCTVVAVAKREREREKAGALRTQDRNEKQETIDALSADSLECNDLSGAQK